MTLGDDHPYRVTGIGSIRVRMFNKMVQISMNVKHIPELKKNLVSLGYLERSGYSFSYKARSGVMNISNGTITVMRRRRLENNLYMMEESMIIGDSDVAAAIHDQDGAHRLWYYDFSHMEKLGMKELSKQVLIPELDGNRLEIYEPYQMGK